MDGNGHVLGAVQDQVGQQVVVPDPHQFQNTHGNQGGLQHGQHHQEEGAQGAAAVDGGGFLNFQRQALDEAQEHEDGKTGAEAQIHDRNGKGGVQLQVVGGEGQGEHDHLERNDHAEQAQIVKDLGHHAVDPGNVPCGHGAEQQNQEHGCHGDEQAVADRLEEGIVAEGHALDVVGEAHKALGIGQGEGIQVDEGVLLEGVDNDFKNGDQPGDAQQGKEQGQDLAQRSILFRLLVFHY